MSSVHSVVARRRVPVWKIGHPTSVRHKKSSGLGGADEVVLANRSLDGERMLGHVGGEETVSSVDVGVGTGVDDRRQFCRRDYGGADAAYRLGHPIARKEQGRWPPVLGEQLGVAYAPGRHSRFDVLGGQRGGELADGAAIPRQGVGLVNDGGDGSSGRGGDAPVIDGDTRLGVIQQLLQ